MNIEENTPQSTCQGCLRVLQSFLPVNFKTEIVDLCFLALPVVSLYPFSFFTCIVNNAIYLDMLKNIMFESQCVYVN